jgi:hypothetical protein
MCNSALMARGESNLMCLELVGGLMVVLDPRFLLRIFPLSQGVVINMKSDIAVHIHPLVVVAVQTKFQPRAWTPSAPSTFCGSSDKKKESGEC